MKRIEIETLMKQQGRTQIDLVLNKDDKLAIYCRLKNGKLYDYTDHVVDRKKDIWGYLEWNAGTSVRREF